MFELHTEERPATQGGYGEEAPGSEDTFPHFTTLPRNGSPSGDTDDDEKAGGSSGGGGSESSSKGAGAGPADHTEEAPPPRAPIPAASRGPAKGGGWLRRAASNPLVLLLVALLVVAGLTFAHHRAMCAHIKREVDRVLQGNFILADALPSSALG